MADEPPPRLIASIAFVGRSGGQVKTLAGFKARHHTLPDAANPVTNRFLGKICQAELAEEAERLFQDVRVGLGYKRKDVTLNVSGAAAVLTAKDFSVEIVYALEELDAARYAVTTTLRELHDIDFARREEFSRVFAGKFAEISFALKKGARIESIVDAIEALDGEAGLTVDYPSDCRECRIKVAGVDAEVPTICSRA